MNLWQYRARKGAAAEENSLKSRLALTESLSTSRDGRGGKIKWEMSAYMILADISRSACPLRDAALCNVSDFGNGKGVG